MNMLDERSLQKLERPGVHPDLVKLTLRAFELSEVKFKLTEVMRRIDKQKRLVAAGASTTLNSRHLTGHANDVAALVGSEVRWDWPLYHKINEAYAKASDELGIPYEWGGNWKSFKDGCHFQLAWSAYPGKPPSDRG